MAVQPLLTLIGIVFKLEIASPYCNVTMRVANKDVMFQIPEREASRWFVGQEITLTINATTRRQARRLAVREAKRAMREAASISTEISEQEEGHQVHGDY